MVISLLPYRQNILDFIQLDRLKNESYRIKFPASKVINIYALIKKLGFAYVSIEGRSIYIQKTAERIKEVGFFDIKKAFQECLEKSDYSGLPDGIGYNEVMNTYMRDSVPKENSLIKHYLVVEINQDDLHDLQMQINGNYRKDFEIKHLLEKLEELKFKKCVDVIGTYHKGDTLYFKYISDKKYIVFNDFGRMFDCFLSTYTYETHIGIKQPLHLRPLHVGDGFKFDRDFHLIEPYL